ncbi:response regulator [Thalassobacterium sedimentorum]|uniref:response regulator n=1 Tax=Thalassobacterium sedimentorum TaxID=3041258 RepID=UPI0028113EC3|nr:response regulator [Coraliomargarita sp. SDUM461004]
MANHYMQTIYGCHESSVAADLFSLSVEESFCAKVTSLQPGGKWTGRVYPQNNEHGISSVEIILERLAAESEQVWLYVLEHPLVNDEVRFSSRSELKMLRVLLDHTLEYVFFRDLNGSFILANEAFRSVVAVGNRSPGVDSKIEDFVSVKSAAWVKSLDMRMIETGKPVVNEVSLFVFQNGTKHWLQLTTVPVRNGEGSIIGSLSVARDISDLKRTESELRTAIAEAHEASRAKGDFLAAMSHEIRTPINGIIGASELCRETPLDIEQRGYLDTVIQCGSTLLGLVNDVLDFSKIEAGQLNLESLNFSPRNLIESVLEEFAPAARTKGIELVVGYDSDLPEYMLGDPTRVKQVFYNLVGNAVKFTDAGEVAVRAEVIDLDVDHVRVLFSVTDTGIGISKDRQDAIFRSFTQADMSTTRKYGGSGLGLSICKELIRLMQGSIDVLSEPGQGARFEFEIPFSLTACPGADAVPFNAELAGLRVLIVDDNQTNCDLYRQMCAGWGYRSHFANDGVSGLAAMEEAIRAGDPYRLILLDQQMPGLTGLDLASLVRSRPDLRDTEIILLSSSLNREESTRAQEIGVSRALAKPVKRTTLQEVILETFGIGGSTGRSGVRSVLPGAKHATSLRVLLVEDNPINQDLAFRRLEKLGHSVTLAENGHQAVDLVQKRSFDCILMDIQMPGMDGFEATRIIRAYEAECKLPPQYIVAMTAHAMKGDRELCLEAGMNNYIPKPFRVEILKEVLAEATSVAMQHEPTTSESRGGDFGERLQQMDPDDREDVLATAPIFLKSFPKDMLKLQNAVSQKAFKECYFIAHTMKGVAGIFGCKQCMKLAEDMEAASQAEDAENLEITAAALSEAMRALANEVEFSAI